MFWRLMAVSVRRRRPRFVVLQSCLLGLMPGAANFTARRFESLVVLRVYPMLATTY